MTAALANWQLDDAEELLAGVERDPSPYVAAEPAADAGRATPRGSLGKAWADTLRAELLVRRLRVAGFTLVGEPVATDASAEPALDLHAGVAELIDGGRRPASDDPRSESATRAALAIALVRSAKAAFDATDDDLQRAAGLARHARIELLSRRIDAAMDEAVEAASLLDPLLAPERAADRHPRHAGRRPRRPRADAAGAGLPAPRARVGHRRGRRPRLARAGRRRPRRARRRRPPPASASSAPSWARGCSTTASPSRPPRTSPRPAGCAEEALALLPPDSPGVVDRAGRARLGAGRARRARRRDRPAARRRPHHLGHRRPRPARLRPAGAGPGAAPAGRRHAPPTSTSSPRSPWPPSTACPGCAGPRCASCARCTPSSTTPAARCPTCRPTSPTSWTGSTSGAPAGSSCSAGARACWRPSGPPASCAARPTRTRSPTCPTGATPRPASTACCRPGHAPALAVVDVDRFKSINDAIGHPGGDVVLRTVAELLVAGVRDTDEVCRWAGDEFVILLPDTTAEQAERALERTRRKVADATTGPSSASTSRSRSASASPRPPAATTGARCSPPPTACSTTPSAAAATASSGCPA